MSHVATLCSAPIVRETRARGFDPGELIEGLDLRLEELERPHGRIPWTPFVIFARRAADLLGADALEELAAVATVESVPRPIRRVLARLPDSRPLFRLAPRWWGPRVFRGTRGVCEPLPDGRLREVVRILPGFAPCPEFLAGISGTMRALPRLLDQPDALVAFEQDGREAEYLITPPPGRSRRNPPSTPRPDTLGRLGRTLTHQGDSDALLRDIARVLLDQHGVGGVRLAAVDPGGVRREAAVGSTAGAPDASRPLEIGDREIGRLELWCADEDVSSLLEVVPWIAVAVDYGRSRALVSQLVALLSDDLRDWERVERRLEQVVARRAEESPRSSAGSRQGARETLALDDLVYGLAPRLRSMTGDEVQLVLQCAEDLPPAFGDRRQLERFVASVVQILCDIGSGEIRIEARAAEQGTRAAGERANAEILVWGRGDELIPLSRSDLQSALDRAHAALHATVLGEADPDTAVGVRVRLPLSTPPPRGHVH